MWAFPAAIALMAMQVAGAPAVAPIKPAAPPQQINFMSDPVLRLTVPVRIGGQTRRFLIDTGAERSGISIELANALGLAAGKASQVTGFAGTRWVPTVPISMAGFATGSTKKVVALAFSRDAIGADGFLGLDSLRGQIVQFDFSRQRMFAQGTPVYTAPYAAGPDAVAALRVLKSRLVFTSASAGGVHVQALLDTGSSLSVGNDKLKSELQRRHKFGVPIPIRILAVTGEQVPAEYVVIKSLWIGQVHITNMPVAFAGPEPFASLGFKDKPALLLGIDALRKFERVEIDFSNNEVRFTTKSSGGTYVTIDS